VNSKELFLKTLRREPAGALPVAPHWWGLYKYEATGRDFRRDAWQAAEGIVPIYIEFFEKFQPDWFHLHIGTPFWFQNAEIVEREGKSHLVIDPAGRDLKAADLYFSVETGQDEEIVDFPDYLLGSRCRRPKVDLSSRQKIDEYVRRYVHMDAAALHEQGYTDHVKRLVPRYGEQALLAVHIPSAICEIFDPFTGYLGFENGLMAFHDYPEGMRYLLERCHEEQLHWARAYAEAGAHAYIFSDCYVSPDLANPSLYRDFIKGIYADYWAEVRKLGLVPVMMAWGDINPLLEDLTEINLDALLIEEPKKGWDLDVRRIRDQIGDRLTVFGNVDSLYLLHNGSPEQVRVAVRAQAEGARNNFVVANGSPITPGTPEENVHALIEAAREG
jgi:uroporphyrinogen-III decarboxylase